MALRPGPQHLDAYTPKKNVNWAVLQMPMPPEYFTERLSYTALGETIT